MLVQKPQSAHGPDFHPRAGLGYHSTFQDIPTLGAGGETVKPLRV
eukprot:COSAG02_NODE_36782_length_450_cov_1.253561_1_plen_44_part_10